MLNNLCCTCSAVWHDTPLLLWFLLHLTDTSWCSTSAWSSCTGDTLSAVVHGPWRVDTSKMWTCSILIFIFVLFLYSVHRYKRVITYHPTIWCHLQEEGFPFHSDIIHWEIICATIAPGLLIRNLNLHLDFCKDQKSLIISLSLSDNFY